MGTESIIPFLQRDILFYKTAASQITNLLPFKNKVGRGAFCCLPSNHTTPGTEARGLQGEVNLACRVRSCLFLNYILDDYK
jgi:hypothetical protein